MGAAILGTDTPWSWWAFGMPALVTLGILMAQLLMPGRWYAGYVRGGDGRPLRYRLNGLYVLSGALALWQLGTMRGWWSAAWLYEHRLASLAGAACFGLVASVLATWWPGAVEPPPPKRNLLAQLFFGRHLNLNLDGGPTGGRGGGRLDVKMSLYLVGAVLLELNLLSAWSTHRFLYGEASSWALATHVGLLSFFVLDYLFFERVHLYTYDLFAERVGFKLVWGCLCFYPYFYWVGLWGSPVVSPEPSSTALWARLALAVVCFFGGWSLARGANMQKFFFKQDPEKSFLGVEPAVVSDGERQLLCSGWWGLARHINYLGEILMASGLALCIGLPGTELYTWLPWAYPLYYVLLLFPRERDDEKRCRQKYGELWERYVEQVPSRIIPQVY